MDTAKDNSVHRSYCISRECNCDRLGAFTAAKSADWQLTAEFMQQLLDRARELKKVGFSDRNIIRLLGPGGPVPAIALPSKGMTDDFVETLLGRVCELQTGGLSNDNIMSLLRLAPRLTGVDIHAVMKEVTGLKNLDTFDNLKVSDRRYYDRLATALSIRANPPARPRQATWGKVDISWAEKIAAMLNASKQQKAPSAADVFIDQEIGD